MAEQVPESLKRELRAVLLSSGGLTERKLIKDYQSLNGKMIPWREFGFQRFIDLAISIPDVIRISYSATEKESIFFGIGDEESYMTPAQIQAQTKIASKGRQRGNRRRNNENAWGSRNQSDSDSGSYPDLKSNAKGLYSLCVAKDDLTCSKDDLFRQFRNYGRVAETHESSRFVFVRFGRRDDAIKAYENMKDSHDVRIPEEHSRSGQTSQNVNNNRNREERHDNENRRDFQQQNPIGGASVLRVERRDNEIRRDFQQNNQMGGASALGDVSSVNRLHRESDKTMDFSNQKPRETYETKSAMNGASSRISRTSESSDRSATPEGHNDNRGGGARGGEASGATTQYNDSNQNDSEVFIGNIPSSLQKEDLLEILKDYRTSIVEVRFFKKDIKCFAFVEFTSFEEACKLHQDLDGFEIQGRCLKVHCKGSGTVAQRIYVPTQREEVPNPRHETSAPIPVTRQPPGYSAPIPVARQPPGYSAPIPVARQPSGYSTPILETRQPPGHHIPQEAVKVDGSLLLGSSESPPPLAGDSPPGLACAARSPVEDIQDDADQETEVFISNIPPEMTEQDLSYLLGDIPLSVVMRSKGYNNRFAFVRFKTYTEAEAVVEELEGYIVGNSGYQLNARINDVPPPIPTNNEQNWTDQGHIIRQSSDSTNEDFYREVASNYDPFKPSKNPMEAKAVVDGPVGVYVGNFPYSTTEEQLFEEFKPFGVQRVEIKSRGPERSAYGFVYVESIEDATTAIRMLDASDFNGRELKVRFNNRNYNVPIETEEAKIKLPKDIKVQCTINDKARQVNVVNQEKQTPAPTPQVNSPTPRVAVPANMSYRTYSRILACFKVPLTTVHDIPPGRFELWVTYVEQSGYFWAQILTDNTANMSELGEMNLEREASGQHPFNNDRRCITYYEDEPVRGYIMNESGAQVNVFAVDYGNVMQVDKTHVLSATNPTIWKIGPMVVPFRLYDTTTGLKEIQHDHATQVLQVNIANTPGANETHIIDVANAQLR